MLPDGRRLGAHLLRGVRTGRSRRAGPTIGATALQVFARQPDRLAPSCRSRRRTRRRSASGSPRRRDRARSRSTRPTSSTSPARTRTSSSARSRSSPSDLRTARAFDAAFVNVHVGLAPRHRRRRGRRRPARRRRRPRPRRRRRRARIGPSSCSRTRPAAGTASASTVDELAGDRRRASRRAASPTHRVGFCLDTAHAWGAGYRPLRTRRGRRVPRRRSTPASGSSGCVMVHLNDSRSELGSLIDRHEHVGAGRIGERGPRAGSSPTRASPGPPTTSRRRAWTRATTPSTSARARDLAAGRPLAALPPEAMDASRQPGAVRCPSRTRADPTRRRV